MTDKKAMKTVARARRPMPSVLSLSVQYIADEAELPSRAQLRRWAAAALDRSACVTIRFVDAREGRDLNRQFRERDYATNVLSFHYGDDPVTGDLVICTQVVRREARAQRKQLREHYAHLVVHGMLHLQGYDHEKGERAARRMENREREVLARFGIADPY